MCYHYGVRIDKYLKVSRLTKRRETARALCEASLVTIDGKAVKPSAEVTEGQIIALTMGRRYVRAKVLSVRPFANKEEAGTMYEILEDRSLKEEEDGI